MGCDGGTIPRRDELVRLKKKPEQKDKDAEMVAKWKHCALSQQPLQSPIVACQLGKLYNKDSVIELLLDRSSFEGSFDHIKGLKDVKELQLTSNPAYKKPLSDKGDAYIDKQAAEYICPISGLEMSGKYKFVYLIKCGCVFSERAMKEIKSDICNKCGAAYQSDDIVILNGSEEDVELMATRMEQRKLQARLEKKAKKKKAEAALGSADGASSSKQAKIEPEKNGTSKMETGGKDVKDPKSKLHNGAVGGSSKLANGKQEEKGTKVKSIQEDPTASKAYKSLFTSSEKCKNQPKAHWVTHNPLYY
jgi:hypothetical protein